MATDVEIEVWLRKTVISLASHPQVVLQALQSGELSTASEETPQTPWAPSLQRQDQPKKDLELERS